MKAALLLIYYFCLLPFYFCFTSLRLAFVLRRQRVLYLLFAAGGAARLALFVETLEELKLAFGVRLLAQTRVRDEELIVHARVAFAYARGGREHRESFGVASDAHEKTPEVVVRVE